MKHIFLLEDDQSFGAVLQSYLEINEYKVTWVDDGMNALETFKKDTYDICVLDVMLPHVDGFTVAKQIKGLNPQMPIIFLTAKSLKEDILQGYAIGADDYIIKPFDSEVLLAKIQAVLWRSGTLAEQNKSNEITLGSFLFDPFLRQLKHEKEIIKLSPKESKLLEMLLKYKNDLMPRSLALKTIWEDDNYFTTRSMDVYITKIRKYLKADPRIEIENIHGTGFRLIISET